MDITSIKCALPSSVLAKGIQRVVDDKLLGQNLMIILEA